MQFFWNKAFWLRYWEIRKFGFGADLKTTMADKIYETMSRNQAKLDRTRNLWNLFLRNFWPLALKFYLQKEDWVLGSVSYHLCDINNFSEFPKVLKSFFFLVWACKLAQRRKSFGNLWGDLYTVFLVLDTKYHFTCGEWNLY